MKTTLKIDGMSCEHCVRHVTEALTGIGGVTSASVNLKKKNAVVEHGEGVTLETMKAAITEAGYEVVA
ncbi:MAG: copper ion binding protein [Treponema sp.]|jgi:copper ion binding protein|nr:copper ion binding protein [Treponema sp.]MDR3335348.1 copper ion binding protein [Treponema sp.]